MPPGPARGRPVGPGAAVVEQDPGPVHDVGHGTGRIGHHRYAVGHRLEQRHPEALVGGQHDQHVGRRVPRRELGVSEPRHEGDRSGQPELGHEPVQRPRVRGLGGRPDDGQPGVGRRRGPGHEQGGDGVLVALVRGEPPDRQPVRAARLPLQGGQGLRVRWRWREPDVGHGHDGHVGAPGVTQLLRVELRHPDAEGSRRCQYGEILGRGDLVPGDPVVPGDEVRRRGDAVVVHDDRFRPGGEPCGHVRSGGHLVHQHVTGAGVGLIVPVGVGLVDRVRVGHLDVDAALDAVGDEPVPQCPGVLPYCIPSMEHGHEEVDPAHRPTSATTAWTVPDGAWCHSDPGTPR
jgi:hypothetical protein